MVNNDGDDENIETVWQILKRVQETVEKIVGLKGGTYGNLLLV